MYTSHTLNIKNKTGYCKFRTMYVKKNGCVESAMLILNIFDSYKFTNLKNIPTCLN